jgi:CheY-like chemotaxis protein
LLLDLAVRPQGDRYLDSAKGSLPPLLPDVVQERFHGPPPLLSDSERREGRYVNAPQPDLVFLDLNLPKIDGHEVLRTMKADPRLRRIPVVVVSSSDSNGDIEQAYDEQASTYVTKPADLDLYFTAIRAVKELWFHFAALPHHRPHKN